MQIQLRYAKKKLVKSEHIDFVHVLIRHIQI